MSTPLQTKTQLLGSIRLWLSLFILGLILSGLTAFPLEQETGWLASFLDTNPILPDSIILWITRVHDALRDTGLHYPSSPTEPTGSPSPTLSSPSRSLALYAIPSATNGCSSSA